MYKLRNKVIGRIIVFLWCCIGLVAMADDASIDVDNLLKVMGEKQGLILHLGAGQKKSAGMTALLAQKSGLPVHGLALDDDALARTQKAILAMNMSGYAMVEKLQEKSLPYNADLATVVVVEDMAMLTSRGISNDEIMRVVAPYGRLCVKDNNKWTVTIKPRSKKMDEWTHPHHGADGSLVSTDSAISFPLRLRWIAGTPTMRGGFGACASTRAVVFAGGRCFAVSVDDPGDPSSKKQTAFLLARDAYSGFPLWKFDCEEGYDKNKLEWRNVWPLVATDSLVYTARTNNLFFLNARSGKVEATCPTKYQTRRLLLSGKYLVAASWEKKVLSQPKDGFEGDSFRTTWWPGNVGEIEVFDSETGASIWKLPLTALTIAASEDTLYVLTNEGNPPIKRDIIGINIATGKEKWRLPHTAFGEKADLCLNFSAPGCVVLSKTSYKGKREISVLAKDDGKVIYKIPNETARAVVGDELWGSKGRYILKTGVEVPGKGVPKTYAGRNIVGGCIPPVIIDARYITNARKGEFYQLPEKPDGKVTKLTYRGARGACIQGFIPANGMIYTAQNNCACVPTQIPGFLAIGPDGEDPGADEFKKDNLIEKGVAFGSTGVASGPGDWPCYRQNNERSGATTATNLPGTIKMLWKVSCVPAAKGRFADAWNVRSAIPQPLTAPVVIGDKVVIAGLNTGEVMAMNSSDGKLIWKILLGSRVDSSPTYYKGLLLVGCHDGWVYALRAKDGVLAYRVRIAPRERSIVAYGIIESAWPVIGSILVHDGIAYAAAGLSSRTDGGIVLVAFKPENGQSVWKKHIGPDRNFRNDIPVVRQGELAWNYLRMNLTTGEELAPGQKFHKQTTVLTVANTGFGKTGRGLSLGKACYDFMAWNDKLVVRPGIAALRSKIEIAKPEGANKPKHPDKWSKEEIVWRMKLKPNLAWVKLNAMALSGNAAFLTGSAFQWCDPNKPLGTFLWSNSMVDGMSCQAPIKLDSPAVYDGFAIGGGKLYLAMQNGELTCWGE